MQLRTKITLAFSVLFAAFVAGDYLVEREVTYRHFQALEEQLACQNHDRWVYAVEREITHLAEFAGDWTDWDDSYDFTQTGNPEFIESNLSSDDWFVSFNLPVVRFYNSQGELVWGRTADAETGEPIELPALEAALQPGVGPLAVNDDRPAAHGMVSTRQGLLMIASRAVFKTDGTGPAQGYAVFGRFLDDSLAGTIAKQTLVSGRVTAFRADQPGPLDPELHSEIAQVSLGTVLRRTKARLEAYGVMRDVFGEPAILVRSDTPLTMSAQGNYALWVSVLALGGAGLVTLALQFGFVQWVVVRPLQRLIEHSRRVGDSGDLTSRLGRITNDEIGELAREFDLMVEQLAASRTDLVAQSRASGQAEIASSVTHNLGNVLNSAVVSLHSVQQRLTRMRTEGCAKAAELFRQHDADLAAFLTTDQKGRQLPGYLATLAESLQADRAVAVEEARRLEEQLTHMMEILSAQRHVAQGGAYAEIVLLHEVVTRAIDIVAPSYARHHIAIETDLAKLPAVQTDPIQLAQVLVNLFTNAKDAMDSAPEGQRTLWVRLRRDGDEIVIEVQDSGQGIEPNQIERIFQAGYSTKGGGRGLGLHFCALAARQLRGTLVARNADRGALFILTIPATVRSEEKLAA